MFTCLCRKTSYKPIKKLKQTQQIRQTQVSVKKSKNKEQIEDVTIKIKDQIPQIDNSSSQKLFDTDKDSFSSNIMSKNNKKLLETKFYDRSISEKSGSTENHLQNNSTFDKKNSLRSLTQVVQVQNFQEQDSYSPQNMQTKMMQIYKFACQITQNTILLDDTRFQPFFKFQKINEYNNNLIQSNSDILSSEIRSYLDQITLYIIPTISPKIDLQALTEFIHPPEEFGVDQDNTELVVQQIQAGCLLNAAIKAIIEQDYQKALKIIKNMTKNEKIDIDNKGNSLLKVLTLKVIQQKGDKNIVQLLKKVLADPEIQQTFLSKNSLIYRGYYKPIQQSIIYRCIPTLTHIFQASYWARLNQIKKSLDNFIQFLKNLTDFTLKIDAKVSSFIPLIEKIAPDDQITIIKKGEYLRADYSLIGYKALKTKRRKMSCIIGRFQISNNQLQSCILTVNHDHQTYTNILEQLTKEQLALIIQDLLSIQLKRGNPTIIEAKIKNSYDIFNRPIFEEICSIQSQKFWLKIKYESKTQKIMPGQGDINELNYLTTYQKFTQYIPMKKQKKSSVKQLTLGIWIPLEFSIKFSDFLQIMSFFSITSQTGKLFFDFLKEKNIQNQLKELPTRIQIPVNFTIYMQMIMQSITPEVSNTIKFDFTQQYIKVPRHQYQKTLQRLEKRLLITKLYL